MNNIKEETPIYLSTKEIAELLDITVQTLRRYDKISNYLEDNELPRAIPEPTKFGRGNYWSINQVEDIEKFKNGVISGYPLWVTIESTLYIFLSDKIKEQITNIK